MSRGTRGRGPGGGNRECPPVLGVDTGCFQGYPGWGRLGEAHSRGGRAWLPGTVGHGLSARNLEPRPAEVRGARTDPDGNLRPVPGGPRRGRRIPVRGGPRAGGPAILCCEIESRRPRPAPRSARPAQAPTSRLFSPRKKLSRDLDEATLQPSARARPAPMLMRAEPRAPIGGGCY